MSIAILSRYSNCVRRMIVRAPRTRVRSWKGRAAMSLLTDSAVPTFVLAGTRKSRVSEMRSLSRAGRVPSKTDAAGSVITAFERRNRGIQQRWIQ